jgi:hypothetical protein
LKHIDFKIVQIDELVKGGCAGCIADRSDSNLGYDTSMCNVLQSVYSNNNCTGYIFVADTELALSRASKIRLTGEWDE